MTPEPADAHPDDPSRSWRWIAERVRAWDEQGHVVPWQPTPGWAQRLRDRLAIWLLLLGGFRPVELLTLRVAGDRPHVLPGVMANGLAIAVDDHELPTWQRRVVVLDDFPGLAALLQLYLDDARPRLRLRSLPQANTLLLDSRGCSWCPSTFGSRYAARLRPRIFGPTRVTLPDLRRACFGLLHEGLGLPRPTVLTALGVKGSGQSRFVRPDAGLARLMAPPRAHGPEDPARVVANLRGWLERVADDIRHPGR
jgi:hypothetical protein